MSWVCRVMLPLELRLRFSSLGVWDTLGLSALIWCVVYVVINGILQVSLVVPFFEVVGVFSWVCLRLLAGGVVGFSLLALLRGVILPTFVAISHLSDNVKKLLTNILIKVLPIFTINY